MYKEILGSTDVKNTLPIRPKETDQTDQKQYDFSQPKLLSLEVSLGFILGLSDNSRHILNDILQNNHKLNLKNIIPNLISYFGILTIFCFPFLMMYNFQADQLGSPFRPAWQIQSDTQFALDILKCFWTKGYRAMGSMTPATIPPTTLTKHLGRL